MQQSQLYPKGYLPVHSMATPTSHYSGLEIQHHLQSSHSVLTSTFPGKPDHELTSTKQNLYDYGRFDFNSQSLPQRTCETCGSQYQCTRATDAQGSASPLLEVCDRCLANTLAYTNNPTNTRYSASHCPQTPSFSPPSRFTGYGSSPNYSNQSAIVPSPNVNYPYQNNDLLNASPQRAFKTPVAPSSNRNGSARSNASKSSTSSPVTSHSAASVTGKESFETASKRPHARGYITTLDARLSRLEVMLGDLVPNSSDQLGSNAAKISNPIGNVKPSETREAIPSSKRREKSRNESALERPRMRYSPQDQLIVIQVGSMVLILENFLSEENYQPSTSSLEEESK
ncbi:uncharacterized protein MELLADRAFT_96296 [Melampsora larici-populina 98AG31]|uniref:Uncharacterized protein n=1 Tax=Melampsora larici-populina (strain 98AG31 / pathotype 3-4-7) TaxID=747676 RepID=F4RE96_MELLP|nr:uncharacterized protein MELLADRAFT_96296 [Melampsora larici-populina 98AG31]EGG09309.1 hypothetical protein MELLADRAFT_96296 [Melampsora larici-populina 98AG31]